MPEAEDQDVRPWFAEREKQALVFRVNRRPLSEQLSLFAGEPPPFFDHAVECLLFGASIETGRSHKRLWRLGNRKIYEGEMALSGLLGWMAVGVTEEVYYDDANSAYIPHAEEREKLITAPFVLTAARELYVLLHSSFAEGTVGRVFESLLNLGEQARDHPTTLWAVEPMLDEASWTSWLAGTAVLDSVVFIARAPNPDAEEAFQQISEHLQKTGAEEVRHQLKPKDKAAGLAKDFEQDSISKGFMEMARRAYASISARGRSAANRVRRYDQRQKVQRVPAVMPDSYDAAQDAMRDLATRRLSSGDGE